LTYKTRNNRKTEKITQELQNEGLLDDHIKEDEMGGICSRHGEKQYSYELVV
jgi:hypothetical protein